MVVLTPRNGGRICRDCGSLIPGFTATASTESKITELDGGNGILRYRGYPIEQLAESSTFLEVCYLLLNGELPSQAELRSVGLRRHPSHVHPREHAQAVLRRLPLRRPPDGHAGFGHRRLVHVLPRSQGHRGQDQSVHPDQPADLQGANPRRDGLSGQHRHAVCVPRQHAELRGELPVDDVAGRRAALRSRSHSRQSPRRAVHPARRPRAELLDHRHASRRFVTRRPLLSGRRRHRRTVRASPWWRQ